MQEFRLALMLLAILRSKQGCTMVPNIYFDGMVTSWRDHCTEAGVTVV